MSKIPINLKTGSIEKKTPIFGIDLGTTNSLVAYITPDGPKVLTDASGSSKLVPSIIHFDNNGTAQVGKEAQRGLFEDPSRTIYSAKRLMGQSYEDVQSNKDRYNYIIHESSNKEDLVKIQIGNRFYTPIELSAQILLHLKERVKDQVGITMEQVVITVPAYFNDAQRQATKDAGRLAGLDVMRIINEPTAAALAYGLGLKRDVDQTVAVYDLGGGTFDITILEISDGVFNVLSTNGDTSLGGDDIDQAILKYWGVDSLTNEVRLVAKKAKEMLSSNDNFDEGEYQLTRTQYETIIASLIDKTLGSCKEALEFAELSISEISEVILVGGSTRIPYVQKSIEAFFKKKPYTELNPDEVVAIGAAIQADILAGNNKDFLLLDVTPLSLGIETVGDLMDILISRNTKIPYKAKRQYTTSIDGQINLKVSVYQGERNIVSNNRKLGEFILKGIPPMPAGIPKIEISFLLDANGILTVEAAELRSGTRQEIIIRPSYGITEEEMAKMLIDSMTSAKSDMAIKMLQEAKNESEQLLRSAHKFIQQNDSWMTEEQITKLEKEIEKLEAAIASDNKDLILSAISDFDLVTRPLAEKAMDKGIKTALKGADL